jgi:hypothetical protein
MSDGALVMLKMIKVDMHPFEAEIGCYFSTSDLSKDPLNHCVPIYDVLRPETRPEEALLVMPYLRKHDDPPMETVGEAVEFFRQVFEVSVHSNQPGSPNVELSIGPTVHAQESHCSQVGNTLIVRR